MKVLTQAVFEEPKDYALYEDEPLLVHHRPTGTSASLIVFVHGLGGTRYGPKATWGKFPEFIFEDFPDLDVGVYAYHTLHKRLQFWRSISLEDEAEVFAAIIRDSDYKTVILVGHSMGGLLCMSAISYLVNSNQIGSPPRIGGLILMATPQIGSLRVPTSAQTPIAAVSTGSICLSWLTGDITGQSLCVCATCGIDRHGGAARANHPRPV